MNIRNFLLIIAVICSAVVLFISYGDSKNNYRNQVKELIDNGALVVDVRTRQEYAIWHYKGSLNIPLDEIENKMELFGSKDNNIVVYCRTGNRSEKAKIILERNGFKNVTNGGGLKDMQF